MYSCPHCHWDGQIPVMEMERSICPRCESEVQQLEDEGIVND